MEREDRNSNSKQQTANSKQQAASSLQSAITIANYELKLPITAAWMS